jgi:hypothetical protein
MDITNTFRVVMALLISSVLIIHIFYLVDVLYKAFKKNQFAFLASELRIHVAAQKSLGVLPNH